MEFVADCEMSPRLIQNGMVDDEFTNVTYELYINKVYICILPMLINPEDVVVLKSVKF